MVLDLGKEMENIFPHSDEFSQGQGKIRKGAGEFVVAIDGTGDFATIQEAINSIPSEGATIKIKSGIYLIKEAIKVKNSITLKGEGKTTILKSTTTNINIIENSNTNSGNTDIVIQDIYFDGTTTTWGGDAETANGIYFKKVTNCRIERCYFLNCASTGIELDNTCNKNLINNCYCENCKWVGIFIQGYTNPCENCIVSGNIVYNCGTGTGMAAFFQQRVSGIYLLYAQHGTTYGNQIISTANGGNGILLESTRWHTLTGNNCNAATDGCGIYVLTCGSVTNGGSIAISGNICDSNGVGILCQSCNGCAFAGNTCANNTQHGLWGYTMQDCVLTGNEFSHNDYANTASYDGLHLQTSSLNNLVSSNKFYNNDRYEINIASAGCSANLLMGNYCTGTDHTGAINDAGAGTILANNIL